MIFDLVGVLVLVVLVVLFGWLTMRAWGAKDAILKWAGVVLAGLLTLIFALVTGAGLIGFYKLNARHANAVASVQVAGTPERIARGGQLANFCAGCHSTTGKPPLDGGQNFLAEGPPLVSASLFPPNLTPGGPLKDWSDGEVIRAIREGVDKDGRVLIIMPSEVFHNMSDDDVQALVAYLRSQEAVQRDTPTKSFNVVGAVFIGVGLFPLNAQAPITEAIVAPPAGKTADYGQYLISISGCRLCHGPDLAGGAVGGFGPPAGPNLTLLVPKWAEADFISTIRTGADPTGKHLNPVEMPWKELSATYTDDELGAIYLYLHALTPIEKPSQ